MNNFNIDLMQQLGLPTPGSGTGGTSSSGKTSDKLGQNDFLKLMTTQLNNQDPTNPMDNGQFLAQIAQFASVSGIQDMQSSIKQLTDSLLSNQAMQAASLVGRQVVAAGTNAVLGGNGKLTGAIDLSQSTNDLVLGVYDGAGQLVRKLDYGPQAKGMLPFEWDGVTDKGENAPAGIYQIKAEANLGGSMQAMSTYVAAGVDSVMVDPKTQQVMLNTSNGESIKMGDVKQIM